MATLKELVEEIKGMNGVLPQGIQCAKPVESAMLVQMRSKVETLLSNVLYVIDSCNELKKAKSKIMELKAGEADEKVKDLYDYIDAMMLLLTSMHSPAVVKGETVPNA